MNVTKTITKTKTATYVIVATILAGTLFAVTAILISKIVIKPNPVAFGDVVVNTTKYKATMATNTGSNPLTIKKIVVSNPAFALKSTSTCKVGKVINPQKACSFIIKFNPTVVGSKSGTIKITDNKGRIATVKITGRGIAATVLTKKLTLSPASLTFDPTNINSSQIKEISVTNSGTALITLTGITVSGNSFSLDSSSTCSSGQNILEPTGTCKVAIKFSPIAVQNYTGSLTIGTDSATNPSYQASLAGSGIGGVAVKKLTLSPTSLTFDPTNVNSSQTKEISITNSGTTLVTLTSTIISGSGFSRDGSSTCSSGQSVIEPNGTCKIVIKFSPTAVQGYTGLITINTDSTTNPSYRAILNGSGISGGGNLVVNNTSVDYGSLIVNQGSLSRLIIFTNTGSQDVTIKTAAFSDSNNFNWSYLVNSCAVGKRIAPGQFCDINSYFAPKSTGTITGKFTINYDLDKSVSVNLSGTGLGNANQGNTYFDSSSMIFPKTAIGSTSTVQTVKFFNNTYANLTIGNISVTGSGFSRPGGASGGTCANNQVLGSQYGNNYCTVSLVYSPATAGTSEGTLKITAGNFVATSSLSVVATSSVGNGKLTASPNPANFGNVKQYSSSRMTLYFTNTGSQNVVINGNSFGGDANFAGWTGSGCFGGMMLAPGQKCGHEVLFSPNSVKTFNGTVSVNYDWSKSETVNLSGVGIP